jgi:hypothetical protein
MKKTVAAAAVVVAAVDSMVSRQRLQQHETSEVQMLYKHNNK